MKQIVELTVWRGPCNEDQAPGQRNESAHFIGFLLLQHYFGRLSWKGRLCQKIVNYGELTGTHFSHFIFLFLSKYGFHTF